MSQQKPLLGQLPDWTRFPRPVCLYAMNEGSGSIVQDLSGDGNSGIVYGGLWKPGKFGPAIKFPSDGDRILAATNNITSLLTKEWTVVFWTEFIDAATWANYVNMGGNRPIEAYKHTSNTLRLRSTIDDGTEIFYTTGSLSSGWNQVAISGSISDRKIKAYFNGALKDTFDTVGSSVFTKATTKTLRIGGGTSAYAIKDKIDNVAIFNRALSPSQIAQIYHNPFPWFPEMNPAKLYVAGGAPPAGHPYYYREFANRRRAS